MKYGKKCGKGKIKPVGGYYFKRKSSDKKNEQKKLEKMENKMDVRDPKDGFGFQFANAFQFLSTVGLGFYEQEIFSIFQSEATRERSDQKNKENQKEKCS